VPYIVVRNDEHVLCRPSPAGLPQWLTLAVSEATEHRYALTFDTFSGADKCAGMQGGNVHRIGDWDAEPPPVVRVDAPTRRVGNCGARCCSG
jgi:hypothetical protein